MTIDGNPPRDSLSLRNPPDFQDSSRSHHGKIHKSKSLPLLRTACEIFIFVSTEQREKETETFNCGRDRWNLNCPLVSKVDFSYSQKDQ